MPARALRLPRRSADPVADLAQLVLVMSPDQLEQFAAGLAGDDLALLESVIAEHVGVGWRTDPATFAHHLDRAYQVWRYVQQLSDRFRAAVMGESKRQLWNLPARYGKSLLASQWGPTWALDRTEGRARFLLISYGKQLSVENALGIRERLVEYQDQLHPGCQLAEGRKRQDRFRTVAGGGVLAGSATGAIRGFGAGAGGGVIVDDPFKDWQEAHSEHRRDLVWNQYRGTWLDRLDDEEAFIIVVHHRVHEDDLTGRLLEDDPDGWEHVVLPAIAPEGKPDLLGREPGEALEPARFSATFHLELQRGMGSYLASALQQQDPTPEEGTDLRRAWFVLYEPDEVPLGFDQLTTSWDLKLKDSEAGDYVVGQAWGRTGGEAWLLDQLRGQWDHATTANAIALLAVRHPYITTHVVETAGSYSDVVPQLRRAIAGYLVTAEMAARLGMTDDERAQVQALRRHGMTGLVGRNATEGDKRMRARTYLVPAAEAGNVHVPARAEWLPHLLDEFAAFPNGNHDDQVDSASQALRQLSFGVAVIASAAGHGQTPAPASGDRVAAARPQAGGSAPAAGQANTSIMVAGRRQLGR
jgi:predicted phage terminase large subunit-like protein